jgi:hypothetical protein
MIAFPRVLSSAFALSFAALTFAVLAFAVTVPVLISGTTLYAQAGRAGLISQAVDESARVVLSGSTHPLATRAADRGAVSASSPANRMLLLLRRSPEQEVALNALIESLHDSNSANFHKWLTPEQFGAQWGAADSDIAAVTAWLQSHGFEVKGATPGRTAIEFSGTAGQVQEAFHTAIHSYMVNGELHHANSTDPQIPAALAPVVAGISTLNDFHPRSMSRKGPRGIFDMKTNSVRPEWTASGSFGNLLYVGPADAAIIYNSPIKALNPAATGATVDGSGAIIGVIGDSNISTVQNAHYRKLFGLAAQTPKVIIDGGVDPGENGDSIEAYIDTEIANGIAPGAKLYFYTAADTNVNFGLDLATMRAVNDNLVDVLNLSFGVCEGVLGTYGNQFYESIWKQAAAQGISVTVSTGDSGSAGCDDPNNQQVAYYGLQVNGAASTPYNIAVGGTDFAVLAGPDGHGADFHNYVSASHNPATRASAYGPIPETPWNDSAANYPPGRISSSVPFTGELENIVAGGGGKSNCAVGGFNQNNGILTCTSGYAKPSWQSAPTLLAVDHVRDIPDVSMFAANGVDFATWGICTDQDQDAKGKAVEDCVPGSNGLPSDQFYISGWGGTSTSAPAFAGVLALIRQSTGERQGQANYALYHLARTVPSVFHDVVSGNISVSCYPGTPSCNKNAEGAYFLTGYNAGVGYDLASGLGSVDVSALVANWASSGLSTTSTQLTLSPTSIQHGQIVHADVTVTGSGGVPTGTTALAAAANPPAFPIGNSIGTYQLKSAGSTGTVNVNSLPGGSYKVTASYGGSTKFSQSTSSPVSVMVTPESSAVAVSAIVYNPATGLQVNSASVPYGYVVELFAQPYGKRSPVVGGIVQPDGLATGKVTFTEGPLSLGTKPVGLSGYAGVFGGSLSPGKYTVRAAYDGDASFDPSSGVYALTLTKAVTQLKLAASTIKYAGKPIVFTATLSTISAGAAPTGTVALKSGSTTLAEAKLDGSTDSGLATGTATISTSNLPHGTAEIYAVYLGNANYAASTSENIKVKGKATFTLANTSFSLAGEHTTGSVAIVTTSIDGYAGTVNMTCKLTTGPKTATPPECGMNPASVTLTVGGTAQPFILIFGKGTTLPPGITLGSNVPSSPSKGKGLGFGLSAGGAVLACGLLFGIPGRRRGWRAMLSVLLLLVAASGFTACISTPKMITTGQYTFTVTGTDSADSTVVATATIKVRVL